MQAFICVAALVLQMVAPYFVWRNRWNVPAHISLGFCVTAYIVPGLLTDVWSQVAPRIVDAYTLINVLGAIAIVTGTLLGSRIRPSSALINRFLPLFFGHIDRRLRQRVEWMVIVGVTGMIAAYAIMGFVPMFAENPLTAKQFKGEYYEPYYRVAYLFRFSFSVLVACLPVIFTSWWFFSARRSLFLGLLAAFLIAISLARASTALGIIIFLGILAASRPRWFKSYLFFVVIVFPLGSAGYLLLGTALGIESLTSFYSLDSVFDIIASGAPDVSDQLVFLSEFYELNTYTYGRTFVGGLVPGNYMWNPSVWTLTFNNLGADISETVSGGLRLSVAMWGYASFGWIGAIVVPLLSGLISGFLVSLLKRLPLEKSLIGAALVLALYLTLGKQLVEFYMLSIHSLPSIACILLLCFGYGRRKKWRRRYHVIPNP
jgi:hypothetical protein